MTRAKRRRTSWYFRQWYPSPKGIRAYIYIEIPIVALEFLSVHRNDVDPWLAKQMQDWARRHDERSPHPKKFPDGIHGPVQGGGKAGAPWPPGARLVTETTNFAYPDGPFPPKPVQAPPPSPAPEALARIAVNYGKLANRRAQSSIVLRKPIEALARTRVIYGESTNRGRRFAIVLRNHRKALARTTVIYVESTNRGRRSAIVLQNPSKNDGNLR